jgi:PAS domain S-box-containing protein
MSDQLHSDHDVLNGKLIRKFLSISVVCMASFALLNGFLYPWPLCAVQSGHVLALLLLKGLRHQQRINDRQLTYLMGGIAVFVVIPLCVYFSGGLYSPVIYWFAVIPIGTLLIYGTGSQAFLLTVVGVIFLSIFVLFEQVGHSTAQYASYHPQLALISSLLGLILIIYSLTRLTVGQKMETLQSLQAEKKFFFNHTAQVPGVIYQYQLFKDGRSRYLFLSKGLQDMTGLDTEMVKENPDFFFQFIHPDDLKQMKSSLVRTVKTLAAWHHESRVLLPGKEVIWVKGSGRPEVQSDGSTVWYGYFYDITHEKKASMALAESQQNLSLMTSSMQDVFYLYDIANKKYLYVSPNCRAILGADDRFFYDGRNYVREYIHPDDQEMMLAATKKVDAGYVYEVDFRILMNGELRWLNEKSFPINDERGNTIKNSGIITDITERKRTEAKLLELQDNIGYITSSINDTFFLYDCSSKKYLYVSPNCKDVLGVEPRFFYDGRNYTEEYAHPQDREALFEAYRGIAAGGGYEIDYRTLQNGGWRWLKEKAFSIYDEKGNFVKLSGVVTDITQRKLAEGERVKSQQAFEEAQELAQIGSWELNLVAMKAKWTKEMYRIFELEGTPDDKLIPAFYAKIHPEDVKVLQEGAQKVMTEDIVYSIEMRICMSGGGIKYVQAIAEPLKSEEHKKIYGIRGTVQDITKQKLAALAKSDFLSAMSHEIRTPINGVIGLTNLLQQEKLTPSQQEYVNTLHFSAQHLSTIVSDILDFSKIESGNFVFEKLNFNIEEVCTNIFKLFQSKASEKNLVYRFTASPLSQLQLVGDYVRLSQVLTNLLSNAVKFTHEGSVDFGYRQVSADAKTLTVEFMVRDTGIGIAASQQGRIFESFLQADSTVTREYGGTGLGLTICKRLVEMQGGVISLESEPGKGSAFVVQLGFDKQELTGHTSATTLPATGSAQQLKGMKVLVAEDNKINTLVITRFLQKWHIEVKVAENGQQALDRLDEEVFDVVLMDLQMPLMDGREATRRMRTSTNTAVRDVPVIALTADALVESKKALLQSGFNDCVTKPFNPDQLFHLLKSYYQPVPIS